MYDKTHVWEVASCGVGLADDGHIQPICMCG
jgi:hypothetical protein